MNKLAAVACAPKGIVIAGCVALMLVSAAFVLAAPSPPQSTSVHDYTSRDVTLARSLLDALHGTRFQTDAEEPRGSSSEQQRRAGASYFAADRFAAVLD